MGVREKLPPGARYPAAAAAGSLPPCSRAPGCGGRAGRRLREPRHIAHTACMCDGPVPKLPRACSPLRAGHPGGVHAPPWCPSSRAQILGEIQNFPICYSSDYKRRAERPGAAQGCHGEAGGSSTGTARGDERPQHCRAHKEPSEPRVWRGRGMKPHGYKMGRNGAHAASGPHQRPPKPAAPNPAHHGAPSTSHSRNWRGHPRAESSPLHPGGWRALRWVLEHLRPRNGSSIISRVQIKAANQATSELNIYSKKKIKREVPILIAFIIKTDSPLEPCNWKPSILTRFAFCQSALAGRGEAALLRDPPALQRVQKGAPSAPAPTQPFPAHCEYACCLSMARA